MKKHEIHLEFMKAALQGSYAMCANPVVEDRVRNSLEKNGESGEDFHAKFARESADAALKVFLARWPDIKMVDENTEA